MAAELVGTAYIAIRAITSGISDDIKDGLDKGAKDAKKDSEKSGKKLGEDMGGGLGEGLGDSLDEEIPGAIKDSSESQESKKASDESGRSLSQRIADSFRTHLGISMPDSLSSSLTEAGDESDDDSRSLGNRLGDGVTDSFHSNINVGIPNAVERAFNNDRTRSASDEAGKSLSRRIGDAFHNDTSDFSSRLGQSVSAAVGALNMPGGAIGFLALNALPVLTGAMQAVVAVGASLVAMLGFIVTAAAGAGVALAGVGAALAVTLLPVILAFKTETPALEAFLEKFDAFKDSFLEVGEAAQEGLLPGLSDALTSLQDLIPRFKEFGREIGFSIGNIARMATQVLTSDKNLDHFGRVLAGAVGIVDSLGGALIYLVDAIMPLLDAAMPVAQRFADTIRDMLQRFDEFVQKASADGSLEETFQTWYDRAAVVFGILGDIVAVFWDIFSVGAEASTGVFDGIKDITQSWQDFTSSVEGKNQIKDFFDTAFDIANEVWLIIKDIVDLLIAPLISGGDPNSLIGALQTFRTDILPALGDLVTALKENAGPLLGDLMDELAEFLQIITDNPELARGILTALGSSLWVFTAGLSGLNEILKTDLGLKLGELFVTLLVSAKIADALGLLNPAIRIFGNVLGFLAGQLFLAVTGFESLGAAFTAFVGAVGAPLLIIGAIIAALLLLYFHFQPFRDLIDNMIDFVQGLDPLYQILLGISLITFGPFITFLAILTAMNWDQIVEGAKSLLETFTGLFDDLDFGDVGDAVADGLGKAGEAIRDWAFDLVNAIPGMIRDLVNAIIDVVDDLPAQVGDLFADVFTAFTSWVSDAAPQIGYYLGLIVGTVIRFVLWELPNAIVSAIPEFSGRLLELFTTAVEGVINYIMSQGPTILRTFWDIIAAVPGFIMSALDMIVTVITTVIGSIPGLVVAALSTFAQFLLGVLEGAFPGAKAAVEGFLGNVVDFFQKLPGRVVQVITGIGSDIGQVFSLAWNTVSGKISELALNIVNFFIDLPSRIVESIGDIGAAIGQKFSDAWTTVKEKAQDLWDNVVEFFQGLPEAIASAISGVTSSIVSGIRTAFKTAWNKMVDALPTLQSPSFFGHRITISPDFLKLAKGAVVRGPTMAMIGEAGAEAVIPLTNRTRALQLLQESGLDKLIIANRQGDTSVRTGPALHIEHATFNDPVTADIVAAKVMAAIKL